ncbi:lysine-specific demethylase 6B-like [Neofelis nebulosa]|uniref:lysine-specific demethylase 6B-like n=1 Tax=Neofelis nebulosa TaxID=61452 RepID=UPI002729DC7C|nr:lysine-specific demethylase 6B-like [Neofelis nebulosa]
MTSSTGATARTPGRPGLDARKLVTFSITRTARASETTFPDGRGPGAPAYRTRAVTLGGATILARYPPPPQELNPPEKPPPSTASIALTGSWNLGPWGASLKARRCLLQTGWPSPPDRWLKRLLDLARRSPGEKTPPRGVTVLHPSAAPPWGPSVQRENEPSFPLLALGHPQSFLERRPAPQPSVSPGPELAEAPGKGERAGGGGGAQKLECRLQTLSLRVVM